MGALLAVVAVPRINKLRVINTLNSSAPPPPPPLFHLLSGCYWEKINIFFTYMRTEF
jgi:hypothetical protein